MRAAGGDLKRGETVPSAPGRAARAAEIRVLAIGRRASGSSRARGCGALDRRRAGGTCRSGRPDPRRGHYSLASARAMGATPIRSARAAADDLPSAARRAAKADVIVTSRGRVGGRPRSREAGRRRLSSWTPSRSRSFRPTARDRRDRWQTHLRSSHGGVVAPRFELFVRPALLKMAGRRLLQRPRVTATLTTRSTRRGAAVLPARLRPARTASGRAARLRHPALDVAHRTLHRRARHHPAPGAQRLRYGHPHGSAGGPLKLTHLDDRARRAWSMSATSPTRIGARSRAACCASRRRPSRSCATAGRGRRHRRRAYRRDHGREDGRADPAHPPAPSLTHPAWIRTRPTRLASGDRRDRPDRRRDGGADRGRGRRTHALRHAEGRRARRTAHRHPPRRKAAAGGTSAA